MQYQKIFFKTMDLSTAWEPQALDNDSVALQLSLCIKELNKRSFRVVIQRLSSSRVRYECLCLCM